MACLSFTTAQELRSTPLEWRQKSSGTGLRMRSVLDTPLRTRSPSRFVPPRAIQQPSLSGPVCAKIRNRCRHLFEMPAGVSSRSRQPKRTSTPRRSEELDYRLLLEQPTALDYSWRFRMLHLFDTMVVVNPQTLPERLRSAGFADAD